MQTSFGCPFDCSYCGIKLLCKDFRQRNPVDVIAEIEYYIKNYKTKDIAFYDDALLINPETHIKPILRNIIENKIKCRFHTPNGLHARFIDCELAELLKRAGFVTLRLSLETTGNKRKDNKVTNDEFLKAVENLKKAGFGPEEINVYTMFGSPDDSPEDILDDIDFVTEKAGVQIKLSAYSLVPGSADYKRWNILGDLDPLWHNNTIFPLLNKKYSLDRIRELRQIAAQKNKKLILNYKL